MCINVKVFDAIAAHGHGCSTMRDVIEALPDIERAMVICAVHRLREKGVLQIHHALGVGFIYSPAQGATRPIDGRGRPRKREQRRASLNLGPLLNAAERQAR